LRPSDTKREEVVEVVEVVVGSEGGLEGAEMGVLSHGGLALPIEMGRDGMRGDGMGEDGTGWEMMGGDAGGVADMPAQRVRGRMGWDE
jgi:hypothetical protein